MPYGQFKFLDDQPDLLKRPEDSFANWQQRPTPQNASKLLAFLQPTIDKGISAHVGLSTSNLRSRGRQLALQAARSYDPSKGAKLETHVMNQLQGLKRIARQQEQIAHVPERVSLENHQLHRSSLELEEQLGREPSTAELAEHTGLSPRRIAHVRSLQLPVAEGSLVTENDGEQSSFQPAVTQDTNPAWQELVYGELSPVHQKVMEYGLGLYGHRKLSNQQIASRLQLSPGRISQIKAEIQQQLDLQHTLSPF